jgi:long-chain acyl-CoA synthetase
LAPPPAGSRSPHVDRLKDVIITSGYKVYPRHVVDALLTHSAIAEAAVVGEPDARAGMVPVAHLVLRPGATADEEELRRYLAPTLSRHETPRRFRFHDTLPRTPAGKVRPDVLAAAS